MRPMSGLHFCLVLCALAPTFAFALTDAQRAEEAEVYEREELEYEKSKMDPNVKIAFEGVVRVDTADFSATPGPDASAQPEGVVGTFTINGKDYLLKTVTPHLLGDLKKLNGKTVTLIGKIRVNGKYFIAQAVEVPLPGPPRVTRGKRGGA